MEKINLNNKRENPVPSSEICNNEDSQEQDNSFDGDVEVLMGEDVDLRNAKVEKVFKFSK